MCSHELQERPCKNRSHEVNQRREKITRQTKSSLNRVTIKLPHQKVEGNL